MQASMSQPERYTFPIHPLTRFAGKCAKIRRPKEITCFSYDDNHELLHDDSSLRYYYTPDIYADLNQGFEIFDPHDDSVDEHLDSLLAALVQAGENSEKDWTKGIGVVTWRGMMTKLMTVLYMGNGFEMNAAVNDGTIYIEENFEFKQTSRGKPDLGQQKMSFWGYKFETLSTLSTTWAESTREYIEGRKHQIVSNKAQYCSIVKTTIGNTSMILAGEVDAVWDAKPLDPSQSINYVELKTSKQCLNDRDRSNFERKLQRFWAQSFLLGVPKLIVGFRDNYGILQEVEVLETEKIPGMVKKSSSSSNKNYNNNNNNYHHQNQNRNHQVWDGTIVINFTAALLEWLRETIGGKGGGMWRIKFKERGSEVEVFRMSEQDTGGIFTDTFVEWKEKVRHIEKDTLMTN